MPTISVFYGICIRMFVKDHAPPHFHAIYGGKEALISIHTGDILKGKLPRSAAFLVKEWCNLNRGLLMENWHRSQSLQPLERILGLDDDQGD